MTRPPPGGESGKKLDQRGLNQATAGLPPSATWTREPLSAAGAGFPASTAPRCALAAPPSTDHPEPPRTRDTGPLAPVPAAASFPPLSCTPPYPALCPGGVRRAPEERHRLPAQQRRPRPPDRPR